MALGVHERGASQKQVTSVTSGNEVKIHLPNQSLSHSCFCLRSLDRNCRAQPGGRLIVLRVPNFGWNLSLHLQIDGRTVANVVQGRRYDHSIPAGRRVLTVSGRSELLLLSADIDRAERQAGANIRVHGIMAGLGSRRSRSISSASRAAVLVPILGSSRRKRAESSASFLASDVCDGTGAPAALNGSYFIFARMSSISFRRKARSV